MHVFALFLAAKQLALSDAAAETQLFIDAVKGAHVVLRLQEAVADRRDG
jgi:hypothetical protein